MSNVEINRAFPKQPHNISESEAWKTATILSSIVSFTSFSTINFLSFSPFLFSRAKTRAFTSYTHPVSQYTYANSFACTRLDIDANAVSHSVSTREGESRFSTIRYQSFAFKVFSSLCFAPTFCSAQKRTFNRVERGNFRGLSRERCYSRGNSNIAFWSKTEFWSRAPWMLL